MLAPSSDCFGPGSRILITTRDKHLLTAHEVDEVYDVKMLDEDQSMKLFSLSAFKTIGPPEEFLELAGCAVSYAGGLPLALTVLGSHLYRRSIDEWKATLASCKGEEPHIKIRSILKISYDALVPGLKEYFLDIACFFKGEYVHDVKPILEACYDLKPATAGITQLQQKALIRIEEASVKADKIWMHDLIEEMGKDIVHQESPDEPGGRSRLWCEDDVDHVLANNPGTNNIKGIQFESVKDCNNVKKNDAKNFSVMKKLRYLSIRGLNCGKSEIGYLFEELRCLNLYDCSMHSIFSGFHANKLVKLRISDSFNANITRLWDGGRGSWPTIMSLISCDCLTKLPTFSGIPNLKELDLSDCWSLVEIPDSVGLLDKLVTLSVMGCANLIRFPRKINLKAVETISITECSLEEFSEVGEDMCSLKSLYLSDTGIKELHPSIGKLLIGLEELSINFCENLTSLPDIELGNLKSLSAGFCPELAMSPKFPVQMNSFRQLDLTNSGIRELDESIGNLIGLEKLVLVDCENLTSLPCSIYGSQHLKKLNLSGCSKLVRFPRNTNILNDDACSLSLPRLQKLLLGRCSSLSDCDFLTTLDCCQTLEILDLSSTNLVSLPSCFTKFVKLRVLKLCDCKRLRELPELPPNLVELDIDGCELLERCPDLSKFGYELLPRAVIEEDASIEEEASVVHLQSSHHSTTPQSLERCPYLSNFGFELLPRAVIEEEASIEEEFLWLCSSSESPKRHRIVEEPSKESPGELSSMLSLSCVNPPKRQRIAGEASVVHSTTPQLQHQWVSVSLSDSNQH